MALADISVDKKEQIFSVEIDPNIRDIDVAKKMLKINQSANDRSLEYDLSFLTVKRLMSYKKCYYTGKEFKDDGLYARSFDRVDSAKGYVEGNVVACTVDINQKKSNLSLDEITILYNKLVLNINSYPLKINIWECLIVPILNANAQNAVKLMRENVKLKMQIVY